MLQSLVPNFGMLRGFFSSQPSKARKTFWSSNVWCQILECREVFFLLALQSLKNLSTLQSLVPNFGAMRGFLFSCAPKFGIEFWKIEWKKKEKDLILAPNFRRSKVQHQSLEH
jgi:hypothetical protein